MEAISPIGSSQSPRHGAHLVPQNRAGAVDTQASVPTAAQAKAVAPQSTHGTCLIGKWPGTALSTLLKEAGEGPADDEVDGPVGLQPLANLRQA
jgi:hypothetical protein